MGFLGKTSIKWRIFIYLIGFCLLLLALLWAFQIVFLDAFYKNIKTGEIRRDSEQITGYLSRADWQGLFNLITERGDLYIEVWSASNGTVILSPNYPDGVQARLSYYDKIALYIEAGENGESLIKRYNSENRTFLGIRSSESIMYTRLVDSGGEYPWLLMVSANISPVDATVTTLRVQLYVISAVMLSLSIFLAFLIANRVSKPIRRLNESAAELGRGNYGADFSGRGYREIAELSDTLENAAKELSKTESLRRELIANVSHDLRTPLTLITGYSEMIRDIPGENIPDNMQVIIDESTRLTSLVNDLLDLSKLQSDTGDLYFTRFSLTKSVEEIIGRFSRLRERENYKIEFMNDGDAWVFAAVERISQVIYNLLINAMTYTGSDKSIRVRQEIYAGKVYIHITDTGEGISPEQLPYVWDRYYRTEETHKRAVAGSGLGLSIVKSVLERHPGVEYGVQSTPDMGSTFWFALPLCGYEAKR